MVSNIYYINNDKLIKRFVKDYSLPFSIAANPAIPGVMHNIFVNELELYQDAFETVSKWNMLSEMINAKFNGNVDKFITYYYDVRNTIINKLIETNEYKKFNEKLDMKQFNMQFPYRVKYTSSIFNQETINKKFICIDLRSANYQILHKYGIVSEPDYSDFMANFTEHEYFKDSKYIRQYIFGNMNPKRQITIEKYYMKLIYTDFFTDYNIAFFGNDEFYLEGEIDDNKIQSLKKQIYDKYGLDTKIKNCIIEGYTCGIYRNVIEENSNNNMFTFFKKTNKDCSKYKSIPTYYSNVIMYALYNNVKPLGYKNTDPVYSTEFCPEWTKVFLFNNEVPAKILNDFIIRKIS